MHLNVLTLYIGFDISDKREKSAQNFNEREER